MDRRAFLKKSLDLGVVAGAAITFGGFPTAAFAGKAEPDLVGVMGGEPDVMFDKGIDAMGGMQRFVKPNQEVVIKPNIGWDTRPERAADTNPVLIGQMVKQCLAAGAKKVYVFDHTADEWRRCYENSGIRHAVEAAGGTMVPGNNERYYRRVDIPKGRVLKEAYVHDLYLDADVFINVPVLKNHIATKLTIGMKNLMGVVWDRGWWHRNDLHQCVADFATFKRPELTVIDAYRVLTANGPMGVSVKDTVVMKALLMASDPVVADTAATKLYGMNPAALPYLGKAQDLGVGTMDLKGLNIKKIRV